VKAINYFVAVGIALLMGFTSISVGQNPPDLPDRFSTVVTDESCSETHLCDPPYSDCMYSDMFYVPSDGWYTVRAELVGPCSCEKCLACAHVLQGSTEICVVHTVCQANNCYWDGQCYLQASFPYTLVVCKRLCRDGQQFSDCACSSARAKISY
jgi:hypothetical protein